jgi:hypothetical protein
MFRLFKLVIPDEGSNQRPSEFTRNQAQSRAIKEASTTRARRLERVLHDCEEELHDEEAAEHDDEEEVDPHVPDD